MATGQLTKCAYGQATTWGTSVDIQAAGKGFYADSVNIEPKRHIDMIEGPNMQDPAGIDDGPMTVEGSIVCPYQYDGALIQLLADIMGSDTSAEIATPAFSHLLRCADSPKIGTLMADKVFDIFEVPTLVATGFTISGEYPGYVKIEIPVIGHSKTNAGTNTSFASVTFVTAGGTNPTRDLVPYMQGINFSFGLASANRSALTRYYINSFNFTFTRPMEGEHVPGTTYYIQQPETAATRKATLSVTFATLRSGDTTEIGWIEELNGAAAATEYAAYIDFDGLKLITGDTDHYRLGIDMPSMKRNAADSPIGGPGKMSATFNYDLSGNTRVSTDKRGWGGNAALVAWQDMFYLMLHNEKTTDYDA